MGLDRPPLGGEEVRLLLRPVIITMALVVIIETLVEIVILLVGRRGAAAVEAALGCNDGLSIGAGAHHGEPLGSPIDSRSVPRRESLAFLFISVGHAEVTICVVSIVREGFRIVPQKRPVVPKGLPEYFGSPNDTGVVREHIMQLLEKRAIYPVSTQVAASGITSPLLLVKKKGGQKPA
jgi:hypothetical protein